jgi:parvulin-like peptidyl-prolyl isomerase
MVRRGLGMLCIGLAISCLTGVVFGQVDKIVAVVNNEVITQKDVDGFAAIMYLEHANEYKEQKELDLAMEKWRKDALEKIIEERLMIQEAKKEKLVAEPELIERRLNQVKRRFSSPEGFEQAITSEGLTVNDIKNKITEQLLMQKIFEAKIKDKIAVSPAEITDYYQRHKEAMVLPEQAVVDSIFIPIADSEGIARQKAGEALAAIKRGEDFLEVGKRYSYAPSLGKVTKGQLRQEIEEAIFKLEKGAYSQVIKTDNGFYIFKLNDILPAKRLEFKEVNTQIIRMISAEKAEKEFSRWIKGLKDKAYIDVR